MDQQTESSIFIIGYLALGLLLISGAISGVRQGKFVLGRRIGFNPRPVSRDNNPAFFWIVVTSLAGGGIFALVAVWELIQNSI